MHAISIHTAFNETMRSECTFSSKYLICLSKFMLTHFAGWQLAVRARARFVQTKQIEKDCAMTVSSKDLLKSG